MIPREVIDEIKERANIIDVISNYIKVQRKGDNGVAICPFHNDKHPSMQINSTKKIYHCFACGAGGNVFNFVSEYEKIPFTDAIRKVATMVGYSDKSLEKQERQVNPEIKKLIQITKEANDFYTYTLKTNGAASAQDYLLKRNISPEMQEYFSLGYALPGDTTIQLLRSKGHSIEDLDKAGLLLRSGTSFLDRFAGRITFPICNEYGEVVAFSARRLTDDDSPKYLLSPTNDIFNKSEILYNFHNASKEAKKAGYLYLCEGFMDVFAMYKAGEKASVALMGVALTPQNAKKIKRLNVEVRLCLDGDNAGQEGQLDMIERLEEEGISYRIVNYNTSTLDPDEILQKYDANVLSKLLNRLISKEQFLVNFFKKRIDTSSMDGKKALIKALIPYGNYLKNEVDKEFLAKCVAQETGLSEKVFLSQLSHEIKVENIDFTPINNYRTAIKRTIPSGVVKLQNEVLYQMLTNEGAVEIWKNGNYRFYDKQIDDIFNYLVDFYDKKNPADPSSFISYLTEYAGNDKATLIRAVTELVSTDHPPYQEESMKQTLDILKFNVDKIIKHNKTIDKMKGKSPDEQAKIVQSEVIDANKRKGD